jgi:hypothetical protein
MMGTARSRFAATHRPLASARPKARLSHFGLSDRTFFARFEVISPLSPPRKLLEIKCLRAQMGFLH